MMEVPPYSEHEPMLKVQPASTTSSGSSSAGSGGLLSLGSSLLGRASCICLHVDNEVVFLRPVPASASEPIPETIVTGYAVLNLVAPRRVRSFTVSLLGVTEVGFIARPTESQVSLSQELSLPLPVDEINGEVPAGMYSLPFQFNVPGTAAPFEESKYGRTRHKIIAKAKGAGRLGTSVEAEKEFDITTNPGWWDPSRDFLLDLQLEEVSPELGPFRMSMHSRLFVVSGLLLIRFALASPPRRLTLQHVKVSILADWTLVSTHKDRTTGLPYVEKPPVDDVTIALIDATRRPDGFKAVLCDGSAGRDPAKGEADAPAALARLDQGERWEMTHLARLPNDDVIQPSTHPNTKTSIRLSHSIAFEVVFTTANGVKKQLVVKRPVFLSSCCCLLASVILPSYAKADPSPLDADLDRFVESRRALLYLFGSSRLLIQTRPGCLCGISLSDMKSAQDPTTDLDGPLEAEDVVPIKTDEERVHSTASVTLPAASQSSS